MRKIPACAAPATSDSTPGFRASYRIIIHEAKPIMSILDFPIPAPLALALIAAIGYFVGRRGRKQSQQDAQQARLELKRAKAVASDMYLRMRHAIDAAKAARLPKQNNSNIEEILYEGYGPGGVAVLCEIRTDNRNRTTTEIRKIFELAEGQIGATGSVAWMFQRKGLLLIAADNVAEAKLQKLATKAGACEVKRVDDNFEITCEPEVLNQVATALERNGIPVDVKEVGRIPTSTVELDADTAAKVRSLMKQLDDHAEVKSVASNFKTPQEALAGAKS
jgi:YebC/PmpR family DNA-binding regulatory protein